MKLGISFPGLAAGAVTAPIGGLLVSHYSLAWLLMGVAAGMVIGAAFARYGQVHARENAR